jgi:hypothetical protein
VDLEDLVIAAGCREGDRLAQRFQALLISDSFSPNHEAAAGKLMSVSRAGAPRPILTLGSTTPHVLSVMKP